MRSCGQFTTRPHGRSRTTPLLKIDSTERGKELFRNGRESMTGHDVDRVQTSYVDLSDPVVMIPVAVKTSGSLIR